MRKRTEVIDITGVTQSIVTQSRSTADPLAVALDVVASSPTMNSESDVIKQDDDYTTKKKKMITIGDEEIRHNLAPASAEFELRERK